MSLIQEMVERIELQTERGYPPSELQQRLLLLRALDVIANELKRIADNLVREDPYERPTW